MSAHVACVFASLANLGTEGRMGAVLAKKLAPGELVLALFGVFTPGAGLPAHRGEPRLVAPLGVHSTPDC